MSVLTEDQMRDAFNLFDTDASGEITVEELAYALQGVGQDCDLAELKEMISKGDQDHDGMVDFEEFKDLVNSQMKQADGPEEVLKAFQSFDTTHTGEITIEDLSEVARSLGYLQSSDKLSASITGKEGGKEGLTVTPYDVQEIYDYCAANDDGKFSFYAWRKVMDEMKDTGRGRGDASLYKELPHPDDDVWQQLEQKNEEEKIARREKAIQAAQEVEERRAVAKSRRTNAQKGAGDSEAAASSAAASNQIRRGSQPTVSWEDQKLKLRQRQDLQQKQREEEERRRAEEAAEDERVARKLEEKRV